MTASPRHTQRYSSGSLVLVFGVVAVLYFARQVLIPLAFALILTFVLTPVVALLQRLRIGRAPAVILAVFLSMTAVGWVCWILASQLVDLANELPLYRQNIRARIEAVRAPGKSPLSRAAESVKEIGQELSRPASPAAPAPIQNPRQRNASRAGEPLSVEIVQSRTSVLMDLRNLVQPFLAPLALIGIVFIFAIFMLIKREDLRNRLLRLAGLSQINIMTQALDDAAERVSRYLLLQFLINAGFGAIFGIGIHFLGLPNPMLWGAVAAALRFVPYVGTLVAAAMPIVLSLAVFDGWLRPLLVFALFAVLELTVANLVEPYLYGVHTGISALALLVTTVFWTVLWGPAGLVLSTPLTVCVVVLGRYLPQFSFLHILLGDEPVLELDAQLYQRLLAMDQTEARTIVDSCLEEKSLVELYDSVLIPALSLAERDRHNGAIDATREEFLFLHVSEMIAEFSEQHLHGSAAKPGEPFSGRVLCFPSYDQADEITAAMLAQLLQEQGCPAISFTSDSAYDEEILSVNLQPDDIIVVSALPPYAFAPARTMCKKVRARHPHSRLLVGIWGFKGDPKRAKARFDRNQPDSVITSLADAVEQVMRLGCREIASSERLAAEAVQS